MSNELKNVFSKNESFSWGKYKEKALITSNDNSVEHGVMGILGELGELILEFNKGNFDSTVKELGDFLWYFNLLVNSLEGNLEDVVNRFIDNSVPSFCGDIECIMNLAESFKKDIFYKKSSKEKMLENLTSWFCNEFKCILTEKLIERNFITEKTHDINFDLELESLMIHAAIENIEKLKVRYPNSRFDIADFEDRVDVK